MTPPADDEAWRQVVRTADRLRVLGPRWAERARHRDGVEGPEPGAVRAVLQELADAAPADAAHGGPGGPAPRVPALGAHALADQLLVLAGEARAAGRADVVTALVDRLRADLP